MGSPFPGMDPYLEGEMWMEFHDRLANQISEQLLQRLPERYVALLNKHYWLDTGALEIVSDARARSIYPDVHVVELPEAKEAVAEYVIANAPARELELVSPIPQEIPALSVEIRDVAERRLVTVIEILSPANKRGEGWEEYDAKRLELLGTRTHLVEIDLLRAGQRIHLLGELPPAPYFVFTSRVQRRPRTQVFPIGLREKLPTIPIPLLPPDPDVPLDLQAAVDTCFNLVRYERLLDYTQPLPPPELGAEDAQWVEEKIRAAGYTKQDGG
ncbi:MAG: DUF4058 family protein [Chloroflexi bacterium]|nr:DUF4058 family protein [Chloroflexota bacterium]